MLSNLFYKPTLQTYKPAQPLAKHYASLINGVHGTEILLHLHYSKATLVHYSLKKCTSEVICYCYCCFVNHRREWGDVKGLPLRPEIPVLAFTCSHWLFNMFLSSACDGLSTGDENMKEIGKVLTLVQMDRWPSPVWVKSREDFLKEMLAGTWMVEPAVR